MRELRGCFCVLGLARGSAATPCIRADRKHGLFSRMPLHGWHRSHRPCNDGRHVLQHGELPTPMSGEEGVADSVLPASSLASLPFTAWYRPAPARTSSDHGRVNTPARIHTGHRARADRVGGRRESTPARGRGAARRTARATLLDAAGHLTGQGGLSPLFAGAVPDNGEIADGQACGGAARPRWHAVAGGEQSPRSVGKAGGGLGGAGKRR